MGSFNKLQKLIKEKNKFLLIAHRQPDGDCIGGMIALREALIGLGKEVRMVCRDEVPAIFRFLDGTDEISADFLIGDFEVIVLIDNGDLNRTGYGNRIKSILKLPIINIDHHPKNDLWKIAKVNYVDTEVSSSCELIYNIFIDMGLPISPKVATSLLAGIFTDTGGFQHGNTKPVTMKCVSDLLRKGAKLKVISDNLINLKPISTLKLWGAALKRLQVSQYNIVFTVITEKDILESGATEDEVLGLINLFNMTPDTKAALLLYETSDGKIKGSLRTESERIDLSYFAKLLGGGGHKKASGFSIWGKIAQTESGWKVV